MQKEVGITNEDGEVFRLMSDVYNTRSLDSRFLLICDGSLAYIRNLEDAKVDACSRSVVLTNGIFNVIAFAASESNSKILFPFGLFVFSSLCCTNVFYISLQIFTMSLLTIRLIVVVLPGRLGQVLDNRSVQENSIWIIFTLGGAPIAAVVALAAL